MSDMLQLVDYLRQIQGRLDQADHQSGALDLCRKAADPPSPWEGWGGPEQSEG